MAASSAVVVEPPKGKELDEFTLARVKRGDRAACRALVERYQRPVFAVVGRMVGGRDDSLVEDLAQETFLRVFREIGSFELHGPAKLSTWILTIATRLAIDERRKKARRGVFAPIDGEEAGSERADTDAVRRSLASAIERALDDLPDEYRAAFVLRAYHELSHEEIAKALSCEIGTVKSRIARAKERLQVALGEMHHE